MYKNVLKKVLCVLLSFLICFLFFGCKKKEENETTEPDTQAPETTETIETTEKETKEPETKETTTLAPATTTAAAATTKPQETTAAPADGSSIQGIIDTLSSKRFYISGTMNLTSGETVDAKMTCDGDNYRLEMNSNQMKMSIIYLDSVPYLVNNATNSYAVIDDAAIDNLDEVLKSLSAYGINLSSTDIADLKSMMANFDQNMDFSQYIEGGEYSENKATVDGTEYLCSVYKTEYGTIRIYTLNGELKIIDVYDAEGLRQMNFIVSVFAGEVFSPIVLNGLTKSPSILNLFSVS